MKGISLIHRQMGYLDSVWLLTPDDTVMALPVSVSLSIYQFLLAERFMSILFKRSTQ